MDAVAVSGIGANALARLAENGIRAYLTKAATVLDVVVQARACELAEFDLDRACAEGGRHGANHAHGR